MFKKKLLSAGLVAALGLGAGSVFAAPYLYPTAIEPNDPSAQLLEDNDWEILIRSVGDGGYEVVPITATTVIQEGDLFAGVLQIQSTELVSPQGDGDAITLQGTTPTFTSIFLIETTSVTCSDGTCADIGEQVAGVGFVPDSFDVLTFGAVDATVWEDVFGLGGLLDISTGFDITDLDGAGATISDGTLALLFNGDVFNTQVATGTLSSSATSFVDGGDLQYEFGFTGETGATEFWVTSGGDAALPFFSGTTLPLNKISMNITQQWAGPDLDCHNYRGVESGDAAFTGCAQIQGVGNVTGIADGTNWGVVTDTDLWIRPIPEPGTLALLALGFAGLGFAGLRRKATA